MYSVQTLKSDLEGTLHGTTNNQIQNLDGVINRAARQLLLDLDPQETKRTALFGTPIFNGVNEYAIADDVKGNKLIDIRPQVNRLSSSIWTQAYNQAFDIAKQNIFSSLNMFTMNFNTGVKTILINAPFLPAPLIPNSISSLTSNGTWSIFGGSNLTVDNQNYVYGGGSLKFDLPINGGVLENSTMTAVDMTNYVNQGSFFLWVYLPNGSQMPAVYFHWGNDVANYYEVVVTTNQAGNAFNNGWNLLQFDWLGATVFGAPNVTSINFLQILFNQPLAQVGVHVNYLTLSLGTFLEYEYYSKYLFRNASTGAFQETVLLDTDLINLDTESYNLLFNQVAYLAGQQQQGADALQYDASFFLNAYTQGVIRYKNMYKSELQKPQSTYYTIPKVNYGRYFGRRFY